MRWLRWFPAAVVLLPWLLGPVGLSNAARVRDLSVGRGVSPARLGDAGARAARRARCGTAWSATPGEARTRTSLRAFFARRARPQPTPSKRSNAWSPRRTGRGPEPLGAAADWPTFPPVLVALTSPPNVLVVAPHTELRVIQSVVLEPMDVPAQERLEASTDSTRVVVAGRANRRPGDLPVDGARRRSARTDRVRPSRTSGCTST